MNVGEDVIVLIILYVLFGCFDYYQLCDLFYQPHPDQSFHYCLISYMPVYHCCFFISYTPHFLL